MNIYYNPNLYVAVTTAYPKSVATKPVTKTEDEKKAETSSVLIYA